jgi:bacterial/archaeal transporter family protein
VKSAWLAYAVAAAVLYGLHQVFTKLAAERIGEALGGFVVEASAAATILLYMAYLVASHQWHQGYSKPGIAWSVATGICVGLGTIAFFLLFQNGGPLSAVPVILAIGGAVMVVAGVLVFREHMTPARTLGVLFSLVAFYLLRK